MLESDVSFRLLDLNLLRVFDAMMAEGSVAGAAVRLSITPSAVSHALGRLRSLFNDPLFVRSPSGMRATPRGSEIGLKVREGLHYLEGALTPTAFRAAESSRTFTVACSAYVSAVLLPGVIARMRALAPQTRPGDPACWIGSNPARSTCCSATSVASRKDARPGCCLPTVWSG
jgi:DNA-binding transcriptional LysR family regulator